ncbi:MAG: GNAT family N-acetyltransferase, partial [Promethearchaeota archaeon]
MLKIKSVESKDLKKIMILEQGTFKENAFSELLMEKLIQRNFFFLKLENDDNSDEIIGFIIVIRDRADRVNIINFLISQKYQGKGYGTLLL